MCRGVRQKLKRKGGTGEKEVQGVEKGNGEKLREEKNR